MQQQSISGYYIIHLSCLTAVWAALAPVAFWVHFKVTIVTFKVLYFSHGICGTWLFSNHWYRIKIGLVPSGGDIVFIPIFIGGCQSSKIIIWEWQWYKFYNFVKQINQSLHLDRIRCKINQNPVEKELPLSIHLYYQKKIQRKNPG